jgi:hypothetical protein
VKAAPRRRGVHPVAAVVLLLASVAVVTRPLWSEVAGESGSDDLLADGGGDLLLDAVAGEVAQVAPVAVDLLQIHGSYDRATPVRVAFVAPVDAVAVDAAPMVETAPLPAGRWLGEDPPALQIGVVLIGGGTARAVVGGVVVGVGDRIGEARVVGIEAELLRVDWRRRRLNYELGSEWPREFRGELERRGGGAAAEPGTGAAAEPVESRIRKEMSK